MRGSAALLLFLPALAACDPAAAPGEKVAQKAVEIVAPKPTEEAPVAKGRYAPRNECSRVKGAGDFRQRIIEAVQLRDAEALAALAADDIRLDFGGGSGKAELVRRLGDPERRLWDELTELLALGCAANEQGGITIPWVFAQDTRVDGYTGALVTGEDVSVLPLPAEGAEPVAKVSWDVVEQTAFDAGARFQPVKLADGTTGYIASDQLRSLLDYRLLASSRNGRWRITALVAGD